MRHGRQFLSPVSSTGRYLLFCCWCFMDACLLQARGFLEERMIGSGLWAWCSIKGQSQAAGSTWASLGQGSANNIEKELIHLSWQNYNSIQSGMGCAASIGWSLLDLCNALCLFWSLQEGGGSHGSPLSMGLARYHHLGQHSSVTSFIAWLWRCVWTSFLRAKAFLHLLGFVCFWKSLSVSLGDLFSTLQQCFDVSQKTIWKSWRDKLPVPMLWHGCFSQLSPPLVGTVQTKRVNGEVS